MYHNHVCVPYNVPVYNCTTLIFEAQCTGVLVYWCTPAATQPLGLKYSKLEAVNQPQTQARLSRLNLAGQNNTIDWLKSSPELFTCLPPIIPKHSFPLCLVVHVVCLCVPIIVLGTLALAQLSSGTTTEKAEPAVWHDSKAQLCQRPHWAWTAGELQASPKNRFHVLACSLFGTEIVPGLWAVI